MISCLLNIWHIELTVATQTEKKNMTLYVTLFFPTFLFDSSERFSDVFMVIKRENWEGRINKQSKIFINGVYYLRSISFSRKYQTRKPEIQNLLLFGIIHGTIGWLNCSISIFFPDLLSMWNGSSKISLHILQVTNN